MIDYSNTHWFNSISKIISDSAPIGQIGHMKLFFGHRRVRICFWYHLRSSRAGRPGSGRCSCSLCREGGKACTRLCPSPHRCSGGNACDTGVWNCKSQRLNPNPDDIIVICLLNQSKRRLTWRAVTAVAHKSRLFFCLTQTRRTKLLKYQRRDEKRLRFNGAFKAFRWMKNDVAAGGPFAHTVLTLRSDKKNWNQRKDRTVPHARGSLTTCSAPAPRHTCSSYCWLQCDPRTKAALNPTSVRTANTDSNVTRAAFHLGLSWLCSLIKAAELIGVLFVAQRHWEISVINLSHQSSGGGLIRAIKHEMAVLKKINLALKKLG